MDKIGESGGSICHGVGAVGDYEAVVGMVVLLYCTGNCQPFGVAEIGAVQIADLNGMDLADIGNLGYEGEQFRRRDLRIILK